MFKETEPPKEPASKKAERKWRNHALVQKYKAGKLPVLVSVDPEDIDYEGGKVHLNKSPNVASIIETEKLKVGNLTRFETRFKKEIRELLDGHKQQNLLLYEASLQHQRKLLLMEKLRRLEALSTHNEGGQK